MTEEITQNTIQGITQVSVAPLRKEPSDASEMVSQLLFGERVLILEEQKSWLKVKAIFDDYEGWVDPKQIAKTIFDPYFRTPENNFITKSIDFITHKQQKIMLSIGAELPNIKDGNLIIGGKKFLYLENTTNRQNIDIVTIALQYLNTPYLWGGKSIFGIDCSGFTQQVYKICDKKIPRDAYQQAAIGNVLGFVEEATPGDLAFFDNADGRIIHVGILLGENKIIHAHGLVRIDPIDSTGIFNTDSQEYSHKLRLIKRIM